MALRTSKDLVVGVADLGIKQGKSDCIVTHALGSCIGITVFDPVAEVGGMLHFMLPKPATEQAAEGRPTAMFAAQGIPTLFRKAYALGAQKQRMIVCAAGGAEFLDGGGGFNVGKRNAVMMKKLFFKNDILIAGQDIGGSQARRLTLDMETGKVTVSASGKETVLWTA